MVKAKRHARGNNNQTWVGCRILEKSLLSVSDSIRRKGGKNWWGSKPSFSPMSFVVYKPTIWFKGTSTKVS
jgi:hypothetical protein